MKINDVKPPSFDSSCYVFLFKYGIKLMKWRRSYKGESAWIFAKAWTFRGYLILRFRGYQPHMTIFGKVLRKDLAT